jgi:hypothetical protein
VQPVDFDARDTAVSMARIAKLQVDKIALITALKAIDVVRVEVDYDGEGDEGQIQDINAYKADDTTVDLSKTGLLSLGEDQDLRSYDNLRDFVDEFAWDVLSAHHDGFEVNDGGFGNVVIDVSAGIARLEHQYRIMSTDYAETEI